jgi:hypothetical protein
LQLEVRQTLSHARLALELVLLSVGSLGSFPASNSVSSLQ